jgi:gamma-glutamylcyclotransferase (GGCT)/AIG2-like uncharacterized protein YtfP
MKNLRFWQVSGNHLGRGGGKSMKAAGKRILYAAYGSNMNLTQMKARCPQARLLGTGEIEGFALAFRRGYATIFENPKGAVPALMWEITEGCEASLDRYEGYPSFYIKRSVSVELATKQRLLAMTYVMHRKFDAAIAPVSGTYRRILAEAYKQNGLPEDYLRIALEGCEIECQAAGLGPETDRV